MGGFASRPGSCACLFSSSNKKKNGKQRRRRRITRRRIISRRVSSLKIDKLNVSGQPDRSYSNPAFQGFVSSLFFSLFWTRQLKYKPFFFFLSFSCFSLVENTGTMDGAWSDAISVLESEFDDEFYSVFDGMS